MIFFLYISALPFFPPNNEDIFFTCKKKKKKKALKKKIMALVYIGVKQNVFSVTNLTCSAS